MKYIPIHKILEAMPDVFSENGFFYEIVADDELPSSVQGDVDIANHHMRIKESVYNGACSGNGKDRYSVAHEIGHYLLLSVAGLSLQRNISQRKLKAYEDPEWQAECFAGELLMPYHLIKGLDVLEIVEQCQVSLPATRTQIKKIT